MKPPSGKYFFIGRSWVRPKKKLKCSDDFGCVRQAWHWRAPSFRVTDATRVPRCQAHLSPPTPIGGISFIELTVFCPALPDPPAFTGEPGAIVRPSEIADTSGASPLRS